MEIEKKVLIEQAVFACQEFTRKHPTSYYKYDRASSSSVFMMQGPHKVKFYFQIKEDEIFITVHWSDLYVKKIPLNYSRLTKKFVYCKDIEEICFNIIDPFLNDSNDNKKTEEQAEKENSFFIEQWGETIRQINHFLTFNGYILHRQEVAERQAYFLGEYDFYYILRTSKISDDKCILSIFFNGQLVQKSYHEKNKKTNYHGIFHPCLIHAIQKKQDKQ